MTRTVADTAAVLQVIAGEDPTTRPRPPAAATCDANYAGALRADGLKGARLGVLHQAYDTPTLDSEVDERLRERARRAAEPRRRGHRSGGASRASTRAAREQGGSCNQFKLRPEPISRRGSATRRRCTRSTRSSSRAASIRRFRPGSSAAEACRRCARASRAGCRSRDEFREKLRAGRRRR